MTVSILYTYDVLCMGASVSKIVYTWYISCGHQLTCKQMFCLLSSLFFFIFWYDNVYSVRSIYQNVYVEKAHQPSPRRETPRNNSIVKAQKVEVIVIILVEERKRKKVSHLLVDFDIYLRRKHMPLRYNRDRELDCMLLLV